MATLAEFAGQLKKANTTVGRKFVNGVTMSYKLIGAPSAFGADGVEKLAQQSGAKVRIAFPVGKANGVTTGELGGRSAAAHISEISEMDEFDDEPTESESVAPATA